MDAPVTARQREVGQQNALRGDDRLRQALDAPPSGLALRPPFEDVFVQQDRRLIASPKRRSPPGPTPIKPQFWRSRHAKRGKRVGAEGQAESACS